MSRRMSLAKETLRSLSDHGVATTAAAQQTIIGQSCQVSACPGCDSWECGTECQTATFAESDCEWPPTDGC